MGWIFRVESGIPYGGRGILEINGFDGVGIGSSPNHRLVFESNDPEEEDDGDFKSLILDSHFFILHET